MKKISLLTSLLIIGAIIFSACEKDDICVEGDTPLLIISFYDVDNRTEKKAVPLLRVIGANNSFTVNTIMDRISTLDSIGIPLNSSLNTTSFAFITDSEDDDMNNEIGNTDTIAFNYNRKDVFISRACGFVANYENLNNELTADTDNWIKEIEIVTPLVENQNAAHVKIFH